MKIRHNLDEFWTFCEIAEMDNDRSSHDVIVTRNYSKTIMAESI